MSSSGFVPRAGYDAVSVYRAERPRVAIDLSDSTNQWGAAPSALAALRDWSPSAVSEYPSVSSDALDAAFAAYAGVKREHVLSGCGSDNILDAAMRALAAPGARIAHPAPTFAMVPIVARANGLAPIGIPLRDDGDIDAGALLATGAEIIYLCTPNNPTGGAHSPEAVEKVIAGAPGVVIIDEAYGDYVEQTFTARAPAYPHVLCTRTLSKAFGLAGLRVGFGVGAPALVTEVLKARGPYRVNALGERAGTAALTNDPDWVRAHAADAAAVRARFSAALRDAGYDPLPSVANFVCLPVRDARRTVEQLYAHDIAVRGFAGVPRLGDVVRIGLAPWPVLDRVVAALRTVLA